MCIIFADIACNSTHSIFWWISYISNNWYGFNLTNFVVFLLFVVVILNFAVDSNYVVSNYNFIELLHLALKAELQHLVVGNAVRFIIMINNYLSLNTHTPMYVFSTNTYSPANIWKFIEFSIFQGDLFITLREDWNRKISSRWNIQCHCYSVGPIFYS